VGVALLPAAQCQDELTSGALVRVLPDWSVTDGIVHRVFGGRVLFVPGVTVSPLRRDKDLFGS